MHNEDSTKHTDITITCTVGPHTSTAPPSNLPIVIHVTSSLFSSVPLFRNSSPPAIIAAG